MVRSTEVGDETDLDILQEAKEEPGERVGIVAVPVEMERRLGSGKKTQSTLKKYTVSHSIRILRANI
jgi:hypothetical protein